MREHKQTPISVVVPAYNEENSVGSQVEALRRVLLSHEMTHEIIVIDDGSQDKTAERAIGAHARVLRHSENKGYGAALKTGILGAKHDMIIILDADGTYPPDQIPTLIAKIENADMVVGARTGKSVYIPPMRRPAKRLLGWLANRIVGQPIPDLNSGMRIFRRECVKQYFSILPNRFSFTTTITLAMLGDDYRVLYHPIDYHKRIGKSKISPSNFMEFIVLVLRMAMLFQPLKIFIPLTISCWVLGLVKTTFDIIALFQRTSTFSLSVFYQPVLSTSAILLLLVGLQLLLIGMVADALLRKISRSNRSLVPSHENKVPESVSRTTVVQPDTALNENE